MRLNCGDVVTALRNDIPEVLNAAVTAAYSFFCSYETLLDLMKCTYLMTKADNSVSIIQYMNQLLNLHFLYLADKIRYFLILCSES